MRKNLIGIVLAVLLCIILIESYFLFAPSNQSVSGKENALDSTSQATASSSAEGTVDSNSTIDASTSPNEAPNELSNGTSNVIPNSFMPSVPDFTVKYIDYSHDVPPTYGIDQYTGELVITKEGYHVANRTVEFTIKNQPFSSYEDTGGNDIELYYNFRFKGNYGNEWSCYPFKPNGYSTIPYGMLTGDLSPKLPQTNTDCTSISINLDVLLSISSGYTGSFTFPSGGEIEFQAQAVVGHIDYEPSGLIAGSYYTFTGETSDWSETQTITLPQVP